MSWDPARLPDLEGRTFVVTGATAGIGYFAAEQLAAAGASVVLAARSPQKAHRVAGTLRDQVPGAEVSVLQLDLASLASVRRAADELAGLERLDGMFLNGGSMAMRPRETTHDGHPTILGTHTLAGFALVAGVLPALASAGRRHGTVPRVVHASTGFVSRARRTRVDDVAAVPSTGIAAYVKAKSITEIFASELDRRLRAAGLPVASIVSRPGVGVDARTPERAGVRDAATPYRRNPFTPWAQGKDAAAWSGVRALTDPRAVGGEYFAPRDGRRGLPVRIVPPARTAAPGTDVAARVWTQLEALTGAPLPVGG
ncbi:SDR family NAD(P)-dependent oxidoreductase [Isoptericola sp. 4D.3]|jgi:NAD(P)-dependent dehydrogenase (short-subunit alcohol dehydrogenase family)|uniref:SDR family NAD(P)-dependent oxidoreductase n=1 Tax=Isoptericola peretonis TaxID=2918523 RepID=A0ABT0J2L9_9MICO|nr:SDR family NAD(P)-dependent oxidoreductase [Isoptericola sp. 4D.3]